MACVQGVCTCNTHGKGELSMKRVRTPIQLPVYRVYEPVMSLMTKVS